MKTIAYLDCPTGISGDMCLGAVIDAGVPLDYLQTHLARLGLGDEFRLSAAPVLRQGLRAMKANVELLGPIPPADPSTKPAPQPTAAPGHAHTEHNHTGYDHTGHTHTGHDHTEHSEHNHDHHNHDHHPSSPDHPITHPPTQLSSTRHLPEIEHLISQAHLPDRAHHWSLAVFRQLAEAEAAVHGIAIDHVHFHEVGATDAIVDIVGTCLGLDYLGIDQLVCSPLPTGSGRVKAAHGWLPVPAPAVLKLMEQRQMPLYSNGLAGELVTPTGAAIVAALAQAFGDPPPMVLQRIGLGAGGKDFPSANILRLWIGTPPNQWASPAPPAPAALSHPPHPSHPLTLPPPHHPTTPDPTPDTVAILETQVDDLIPQVMGYLYERLFDVGALDVFAQPVVMKKSRPGLLITVICPLAAQDSCTEVLLAETTTLGVRHRHQARTILQREFQTLETPYGPVTLKLGYHPQTHALLNVHPEYEDCATLARRHQLPWQTIYHTALSTWQQQGQEHTRP